MVDRKAVLVAMGVLMSILSITAVALRFLARHVRKVQYGLDDWFVVAALVAHIATLLSTKC